VAVQCHNHTICHAAQGFQGEACEKADDTHCLAGCNGRGECVRGFCRCRPPYYGLGCLKGGHKQGHEQKQRGVQRVVQRLARQKHKHTSRSKLKIYMYDLPWQLAFQDGYHPGEGCCVLACCLCAGQLHQARLPQSWNASACCCADWPGHEPNYISFWQFASQLARDQDVGAAANCASMIRPCSCAASVTARPGAK
jgi:hypothetical protein